MTQEIVRRVKRLFALAARLEVRLAKVRVSAFRIQTSALELLSLPPSPSYGGTGLARAWTHSPPARSAGAHKLREILFARSQRAQIVGQLVPQDPTDEPAEKLLERIKTSKAAD